MRQKSDKADFERAMKEERWSDAARIARKYAAVRLPDIEDWLQVNAELITFKTIKNHLVEAYWGEIAF